MRFKVSAEWMQSCGFGTEAAVLDIVSSYGREGWQFFDCLIDTGYGYHIRTFSEWRGEPGPWA